MKISNRQQALPKRVAIGFVLSVLAACHPPLTPSAPPVAPAPVSLPSTSSTTAPSREPATAPVAGALPAEPRPLMVPVAGVEPSRVPDGFLAARGERVHRAVDILAPRGTPIVAADSGRIYRIRSNALGGNVLYALDPTGRIVYYYAHLDRYREGLVEGMKLAQGEVIGYVGSTGNASPDVPHLHFQVMLYDANRRYWDGTPVDPRPLFTRAGRVPEVVGTRP